jgi:hypothetical protein
MKSIKIDLLLNLLDKYMLRRIKIDLISISLVKYMLRNSILCGIHTSFTYIQNLYKLDSMIKNLDSVKICTGFSKLFLQTILPSILTCDVFRVQRYESSLIYLYTRFSIVYLHAMFFVYNDMSNLLKFQRSIPYKTFHVQY